MINSNKILETGKPYFAFLENMDTSQLREIADEVESYKNALSKLSIEELMNIKIHINSFVEQMKQTALMTTYITAALTLVTLLLSTMNGKIYYSFIVEIVYLIIGTALGIMAIRYYKSFRKYLLVKELTDACAEIKKNQANLKPDSLMPDTVSLL